MNGMNWFWAVLIAVTLVDAGAACGGGDGGGDGKGGTGGTAGSGGSGGDGGTGGGATYDPAVDCAPICTKLLGCFSRGTQADCVTACAEATTAQGVLLACGECVNDNECSSLGTQCFDTGKPCSTGQLFDLTLKGSGFTAFEDDVVFGALVEAGCSIASENTGMVTMGAFGVRFQGALKEGRPYRVDYFIDADANATCDPTDVVGSKELGYAVESIVLNVTPSGSAEKPCQAWNPGAECSGTGPSIDQAICQALAECCESSHPAMDANRQACRNTADTNVPETCEPVLNTYVGKGYCAPSVDCQKLKVCCDDPDFAELAVGCEIAATSASEEICTALLGSFSAAGFCN